MGRPSIPPSPARGKVERLPRSPASAKPLDREVCHERGGAGPDRQPVAARESHAQPGGNGPAGAAGDDLQRGADRRDADALRCDFERRPAVEHLERGRAVRVPDHRVGNAQAYRVERAGHRDAVPLLSEPPEVLEHRDRAGRHDLQRSLGLRRQVELARIRRLREA
jgi:hypothetical protein